MKWRAGFTLIEVLTVMFVGSIVLFLMVQIALPSLYLQRSQSASSEAQQTCLLFAQRLNRSLMNSAVETVTLATDPTAISFLEVQDVGPQGKPVMSTRFQIYFFDAANRRITSKTFPPGVLPTTYDFSSTTPPRLSAVDLNRLCTTANGTERVFARNVDALILTDNDQGPVQPLTLPIRYEIKVSVLNAGNGGPSRRESFSLSGRVNPRNIRW